MEEVLDNLSDNGGNLKVTQSIKTSLITACTWAKVVSIIQVVFIGFGMLIGLVAMFVQPLVGILALALYGFMFYTSLTLLQFGMKTMKGIESSSQYELEQGIEKLGLWFKIIGVFTIVIISLYLVLIIFFRVGFDSMRFF